jgi:hypothetical protein
MIKFVVATDFSKYTGSRYRKHGKHSGEELCDMLVPLLREVEQGRSRLLVDLDGTSGYARSFIEEAFGGLVRRYGFNRLFLLRFLTLKSEEENRLIIEAWADIKDADKEWQDEKTEAIN